jgi:flagella basal body P-ring formation protein FlgA
VIIAFLSIVLCLNTGLTPVHPDKIRKAVESYIAERWDSKREEFLIECRDVPVSIAVSSPAFSVQIGICSVPRLRGYVGIPLEIVCNGKVERRFAVTAHIRTFATVVAASRQLLRHERITIEEQTSQRIETTGLPDDLIFDETEIRGKRAARIIAASTILCRSMLERVPVVKEEDAVTIAVRSGNTTVKVQGVAKQGGCVGDMITVQRSGSHDRLRATVLDTRTVMLDIGQSLPGGQDNQEK